MPHAPPDPSGNAMWSECRSPNRSDDGALRACACREDQALLTTWVQVYRLPRQRVREQKIWGADEIERYLAAVEEDPLRAMWHVAIGARLRRTALVGPRWEDVGLEAGTLRVRQTYVAVPGGKERTSATSGAERRVITVGPACVAALRAHYAAQLAHKLAVRPAWKGDHYSLVFPSSNGEPMHPSTVTHL